MAKQPSRLWIAAFLLGWAFDFLFWRKSLGVNVPIFASLCLLGGFGLLYASGLKPATRSLWLLPLALFFALFTAVRQEPLTLFLCFLFSVLCAGLLANTYLGGRWVQYNLADYLLAFLLLPGSMVARPPLFWRQARKERAAQLEPGRTLPLKPVVRGFVIALPIVAGFSYLLASADVVYNQKVIDFIRMLSLNNLGENIVRLMLILMVGYLVSGALLHAATQSKDAKLVGEERALIPRFLGFTEAAIVLGSVAALFLVFVVVQFQYFFGGEVNIGVQGFTYSQYARRGFNEILLVAFFSLLLSIGLSAITRRESVLQQRIFSALSVVIAALVVVMLFSAWQRLSLAIDWHGFSRLRLYPRVFLVWLGLLFASVATLEVLRRERYFSLAMLLASFGFAATLSLVNVDAAIVRHNVLRETQGRHLNINHLTSLSTDAVPPLAQAFADPNLPASTRAGVGAALLCYRNNSTNWEGNSQDWRAFHLSRWQAWQALEVARPDLREYQVNRDDRLIRVRAPGGEWFECWN